MRQRCTTLGLYGMECSTRSPGVKTFRKTRSKRTATGLHEQSRDEWRLHVFGHVGHLPADGSSTIETPRILRSLHAERYGAGCNCLAESEHARVTGRITLTTWTVMHVRPEYLKA